MCGVPVPFILISLQTCPGVHSASYKMSTGNFPRRRPSVGLATLPLPDAVAVNMWTLAFTSPKYQVMKVQINQLKKHFTTPQHRFPSYQPLI